MGVQDMDPKVQYGVGRIFHQSKMEALFDYARSLNFDSINLDVMFALPGQNLDMALRDVEQIIALGPAHISYYQLTLEPNTVFHSNPPADLPDREESFIIQKQCHALMAANGYEQYEISAFAILHVSTLNLYQPTHQV